MLSEGSPSVSRPACGKKIRKINKQFLYHRDPMCNLSHDILRRLPRDQVKVGKIPPNSNVIYCKNEITNGKSLWSFLLPTSGGS